MSSCNLVLDQTKLPKLINKLEFFMFRALERHQKGFFSLIGKDRHVVVRNLLSTVKNEILPQYIAEYSSKAKQYQQEKGFEEEYAIYQGYVERLTEMLALWDKIVPNFIYYSSVFSVKNKYTLDDEGLVDLSDIADDEEKMFKMMEFDHTANEIDPIDEVDQIIELYLRSLIDTNQSDSYTDVVGVNYPKLIQNLFNDLKNTFGLKEIVEILRQKSVDSPLYNEIADKLEDNTKIDNLSTSFKLRFQNTFTKAYIPINLVSVENKMDANNVIKVMEASKGKQSFFEMLIRSNFFLRGMEVGIDFDQNGVPGKKINLAEQIDGTWTLTQSSINSIREYIEKSPKSELKYRQLELLKGIGFSFSDKASRLLLKSSYLGEKTNRFNYIYQHLLKILNFKKSVTDPYKELKQTNVPQNDKSGTVASLSQASTLNDFINVELKYNSQYNVEQSIINPEGKRQYPIQLHNNISYVTKLLSDNTKYPTLQSILESMPSAFWMDPVKNPSIRGSLIMHSLFYFDPNHPKYGQRRRVVKNGSSYEYSDKEGEFVRVDIVNTGGVQYSKEMMVEREQVDRNTGETLIDPETKNPILKNEKQSESNAKKTTKLSLFEKLLQDINSFLKRGYNSFLRLSDKSTDLGYMMNYYHDPISDSPVIRPLDLSADNIDDIFSSEQFRKHIHEALKDIMFLKYLNKYGYMSDLNVAKKNLKGYAALDSIISKQTKENLDKVISEAEAPEDIVIDDLQDDINRDIDDYFKRYSSDFKRRMIPLKSLTSSTKNLISEVPASRFDNAIDFYLANSFIMDLEQMRLYFGDVLFFKDFHKRSSKDSATGIFTLVDKLLIDELNDPNQGYGKNNNLQAIMFMQQLSAENRVDPSEYQSRISSLNRVENSFNSIVLKDVLFDSNQPRVIHENVGKLNKLGFFSEAMMSLYNNSLRKVIDKNYRGAKEADGQGKCTFDFYRIISILTNQWSEEQEKVYKKIIMYDHYDRLIDITENENERARFIQLRDQVGYDPTESVYFPPKKFQYSGPMLYQRDIQGAEYASNVPVFDKFSLQPLIPTITKNTPDDHLMKRMMYSNVGYAKFESGTKVERPVDMDEMYEDSYNPAEPNRRTVKQFIPGDSFKSQHTLFFDHLKEQVKIDAEIHESSVFGSQIRKLIMMNIENTGMLSLLEKYNGLIEDTITLEKNMLFKRMGVVRNDKGRLQIDDIERLVNYFFNEIERKNQSNSVRKALKYNENTKTFEIPLDASIQAQVIEGIIMSAINNNLVRYKTNGSMLIQVAMTGSEQIKLSKDDSRRALETFGSDDLKYYDVDDTDPKGASVTPMQVKIALTGQWLKLLELYHPDGFKIGTLERLNQAIKDENWNNKHSRSLRMVAYRIPTQGINFMDVMTVKEFLPSSFGDAIVMPSEIVIKSGSDYDIDKMFVFYPNLDNKGNYVEYEHTDDMLNQNLESNKEAAVNDLKHWKLYRSMSLLKLQDEFNTIKRSLNSASRKEMKNLDKLESMVRNVNLILMMMEGESKILQRELSRIALRNEQADSYMNQMIHDSIIFNLDEYESYKKKYGINVLNPLNWIDTKREGLNALLQSINNLQNKTLDQLQNEKNYLEDEINEVKQEVESELKSIYERLYKINNLKGNIQNKLYDVMAQAILHPSNYIQLVTPSDTFLIMPIVDEIYAKIGKGVDKDGKHLKTDYTNTEILNRWKNAEKFISLLRGKSDLGIAAVANVMNVLLQISKSKSNPKFFKDNNIITFFENKLQDTSSDVIDYSSVYDEDGNLKSEFFSEFISAFVDAAKDDYVFAINVVTELSPIMFYMKYMGLSTRKIMYFINQPVIRKMISRMATEDNMFLKSGSEEINSNIRNKIIGELITELGLPPSNSSNKKRLIGYFGKYNIKDIRKAFGEEILYNNLRPDTDSFSNMSDRDKNRQLAVLLELMNLREQSNSFTNLQKTINFDTEPYASTYDIYERNEEYNAVKRGEHVLSASSIDQIREKSMISPMNVQNDIIDLMRAILPIRNNIKLNVAISAMAEKLAANYSNKRMVTSDDKLRFARTAKNDYILYILQNYFDSASPEAKEYFKDYYQTEKEFNEYLADLVTTRSLSDRLQDIRNLSDYTSDDPEIKPTTLLAMFPIIGNIVMEPGENNKSIVSFRIIKNSNNVIDENDFQEQFDRLTKLQIPSDPELAKDFLLVRGFFRDLALYSLFQSGLNTSDISFTSMTPVDSTNKLIGYAINEFRKQIEEGKTTLEQDTKTFMNKFSSNNPEFYNRASNSTPTREISKRGKWYSDKVKLRFVKAIPKARLMFFDGSTKATKDAARNKQGIYSMRPNPGDGLPGVDERFHFGNPWSSRAGEKYFENLLPVEGTTEAEKINNAVANYDAWIRGTGFKDVQPERRDWIVSMIEQGRLFGKTFLYFKTGYRSHAHALLDYINERAEETGGKGTLVKTDASTKSSESKKRVEVDKLPGKSATPKLSTKEKPLQVYSDGSDIKGTGQIGFGAAFEYEGTVYEMSGTEESKDVKRLKELHPEAKFSNPTMEMLALVKVLDHFKDTSEHIVINQDYKGAVNYSGLWSRSAGSEQRDAKPWKPKEKYIQTLVDAAEKLIERIEKNGGSVKILWVKGHSGNRMNELADRAAKNRTIFNNFIKGSSQAAVTSTETPKVSVETQIETWMKNVDQTLLKTFLKENNMLANTEMENIKLFADLYNETKGANETVDEFMNFTVCGI